MIRSKDILAGLQLIVDEYSRIATIWHIFFYLIIAALLAGWAPSDRMLALLMTLPLLSVAILAWMTGNPFNGSVFGAAAVLLFITGINVSAQPVTYSQLTFVAVGIVMIIFGLVYPHFIRPDSFLTYFHASPAGLIPCPTLSVIIGFLLVYNGFSSGPVALILIVTGLFYGLFGVFRLGVYLDLILLSGTITLLIKYIITLR